MEKGMLGYREDVQFVPNVEKIGVSQCGNMKMNNFRVKLWELN